MASIVPPRLEVVRGGDDLEAVALGLQRVVQQLARPELLRRCLVADANADGLFPFLGEGRRASKRARGDSNPD
jgi:hypothetical protein